MKLNVKTFNITLSLLVLVFTSCRLNDEDKDVYMADAVSLNDAVISAEIDEALEQVRMTADNAYNEEERINLQRGNTSPSLSYFPDCLVKLVNFNGSKKEIQLDFGNGCVVRGRTYTGKMYIEYESDYTLLVKTLHIKFEGYSIDGKPITGVYDIVRTKQNSNGNFQEDIDFDIRVLLSNGDYANRVGVKTQELIEGIETLSWEDNVYLVTGAWETVYKDNVVTKGLVVSPLRAEMSCLYYVSGVIEIKKQDRTANLDFGEGACDGKGVLTLDSGVVIDYDVTSIRS